EAKRRCPDGTRDAAGGDLPRPGGPRPPDGHAVLRRLRMGWRTSLHLHRRIDPRRLADACQGVQVDAARSGTCADRGRGRERVMAETPNIEQLREARAWW